MSGPTSPAEVDELMWAVELRVSELRCALKDLRHEPIRAHMDAADRALHELRHELREFAKRLLYPPVDKPARRPRPMVEVAVPPSAGVS